MTPARCAPEATVTTRSVTCGSSRLVNAKWPRWLVPNCSSKPSAVRPAGTIMIPALLTRTWSGPVQASAEARWADGLYVTACEPGTGRAAVSLGLFDLLVRRVDRLGVFRPVVSAVDGSDPSIDLLLPRLPQPEPYEACLGVPYAEVLADEDKAMSEIVERFRALAAR